MAKQTDPTTGVSVPDTATTYERAKPDKESAEQTLEKQPVDQPIGKDHLNGNAEPRSQNPGQEKP